MIALLAIQVVQFLAIIHVLSYNYYTTSYGDIITKYQYTLRVVVHSLAMLVISSLYFLGFSTLFVIQFIGVHVWVSISMIKNRK